MHVYKNSPIDDVYFHEYTKNYKVTSPTNISLDGTVLNVFMCLRNNSNTLSSTFDSLELLETSYPHVTFCYYIFENDSTDDTPEKIKHFMFQRQGRFSCNLLKMKQWESIKSIHRSTDMAVYRNSMKSLCTDWENSIYSVIVDSNVHFNVATIEGFIQELQDTSIAMVTPFGHVNHMPRVYYDTYALLTFQDKQRLPVFTPCLYEVKSAFGGIVMLRTEALQHSRWAATPHALYSEHVAFCSQVRQFGQVVVLKNNKVEWNP